MMTHWAEYLPFKHKKESLIPRIHVKIQRQENLHRLVYTSPGEVERHESLGCAAR